MSRKRIRWFHYLSVDAKAAEAELNALAEQGWVFEESFCGFARFSVAEGPPPRYCAEPYHGKVWDADLGDTQEHRDYIRLCADAGWDLVEENTRLRIFRSAPGADPAPVQTDPALDYEANWDRILRTQQWSIAGYAVMWVLNFALFSRNFSLWDVFAFPSHMLLFLLLLGLLAANLAYWAYLAHRRTLCKKAIAERDELPVSSPLGAKVRGAAPLAWSAVFLLCLALLFAARPTGLVKIYTDDPALASLPVVRASDLGYADGSLLLGENGSAILTRVEYMDFSSNRPNLVTDRYEACAPWLAEAIAASLVKAENQSQNGLYTRNSHLHAPVALSPADLGFDESWTGADGELSILVLREGNVAACVEGPFDLTDPATLALIRYRLGLEG